MQAMKVRDKKDSDEVEISKTAKMVALEILKYRKESVRAGASSIVEPEIVPEPDECIIERMENLFIAMTKEDYVKNEVDLRISTVRDVEPGEKSCRTRPPARPCFYISPGNMEMDSHIRKNLRSMIITYNESVGQSTKDAQDYEEYDESMMPENLPHEIE
ncbi:hypothetical protein HAX54_010115 [Datura stramonium]|uniref:Uncharacterized protein n=1 Tax=Datura stramonium TaxID=4076 RepID=A0ABS8TFV0_DATST|nr:hypothetical protein [Datura stramonium]